MATEAGLGFPLPDDYGATRVPNAVLGRFMATVADCSTLRLVLRAVWLLERQRTFPRFITVDALRRDRVLAASMLSSAEFARAIAVAIDAGVLLDVDVGDQRCVMLNTESARRAAVAEPLVDAAANAPVDDDDDGWGSPAADPLPADALRAYEANIGPLTPMIRESILSALEDFTDEDVTRAVRIAVENESRSWAFVAGVLRRWIREGVPDERRDGDAGGADRRRVPEDQLQRYLEQQRKRD